MAPLKCVLRTKAAVTSSKKSITRNLEVKTEHDIVRNGTAGDITYMIDKETNVPSEGRWSRCNATAWLGHGTPCTSET